MSQTVVGPQTFSDGAQPDKVRLDRAGAAVVSQSQAPYFELSNRGQIFTAHAIVTAPVIYTTAAGTGGPLLWNGSTTHKLVILSVGWGISTASAALSILGLTGGTGQTTAPSSTTAVDSVKNTYLGGAAPAASAYRVGTVAAAGNFFYPLGDVNTAALTTAPGGMRWADLKGLFVIPQYGWISFAGSATATSAVINAGITWAEVPNAG